MAHLDVGTLILAFGVLLLSLSVHEWAHAWTADRLGDPTARLLGRVSLNPAVHIDPIGTLLLPIVAVASGLPIIGWAKPVPVSPWRLRNPRRDFVAISAAGPVSNLALAVVASIVLRGVTTPETGPIDFGSPLVWALALGLQVNVLLAFFNLIPVPPLDGGNVLGGLLPQGAGRRFDAFIRPYGFLVLYGLLLTGLLDAVVFGPAVVLTRVLLP